ncbi:MAG: serine protease, partial [Pseudomonadota bacterium]
MRGFLGHKAIAAAAVVALSVAVAPAPIVAQEIGPRSVADLAEGLLGSVVNISTSQRVEGRRASPTPEGDEDTPFQEFFDDFF